MMFKDTSSRRGRLSNKSLETALAPVTTNSELNRKIALATECFTTTKSSELILKDRTRLTEENALTVCNYIIEFKYEANPRLPYIQTIIQCLSELSKAVGIEKRLKITRKMMSCYTWIVAGSQDMRIQCINGLECITPGV
jgi:23S rRNA A1618 N6-methylase RlmF